MNYYKKEMINLKDKEINIEVFKESYRIRFKIYNNNYRMQKMNMIE